MKKIFKVRDLLLLKSIACRYNGLGVASKRVDWARTPPESLSFTALEFGPALKDGDEDDEECYDLFKFIMSLGMHKDLPEDKKSRPIELSNLFDILENYSIKSISQEEEYKFNSVMNSNIRSIQIYNDNLCVLVERPRVTLDFDGKYYTDYDALSMLRSMNLYKFPKYMDENKNIDIALFHDISHTYYKVFDGSYYSGNEIKIHCNFSLTYTPYDEEGIYSGLACLVKLDEDGFFEDNTLISVEV